MADTPQIEAATTDDRGELSTGDKWYKLSIGKYSHLDYEIDQAKIREGAAKSSECISIRVIYAGIGHKIYDDNGPDKGKKVHLTDTGFVQGADGTIVRIHDKVAKEVITAAKAVFNDKKITQDEAEALDKLRLALDAGPSNARGENGFVGAYNTDEIERINSAAERVLTASKPKAVEPRAK